MEGTTDDGRSPRVRGRPGRQRGRLDGTRTIPACAGETQPHAALDLARGDDPRVCGGDVVFRRAVAICSGRSPRVRGRLGQGPDMSGRPGTIPACAGETRPHGSGNGSKEDDPRVCGGDGAGVEPRSLGNGRSPRVRGRLARRRWRLSFYRTIPACAGETDTSLRSSLAQSDDPRVCGGDENFRLQLHLDEGRSPRVRGRPDTF